MGSGVWYRRYEIRGLRPGLGFEVWDLGLGSGVWDLGSGFGIWRFGLGSEIWCSGLGFGSGIHRFHVNALRNANPSIYNVIYHVAR